MNSIGFTGTQQGLTPKQREELTRLLRYFIDGRSGINFAYFHHGDCIGADEEADRIARARGYQIILHPPTNIHKRAHCERRGCFLVHKPLPYLARDEKLVSLSNVLIACPKEDTEQIRSGTWTTVRYAKKAEIPVHIILPGGEIRSWKP